MCDRLVNSQSILKPIMLVAGHWCQHLINVWSSMLCYLSITSVVDA